MKSVDALNDANAKFARKASLSVERGQGLIAAVLPKLETDEIDPVAVGEGCL
jgi:hypothetical protein